MRTGIQWNEFKKLNIIGPEYSGICKKQGKWVKYGVFKEFWKRCIIFYSKSKGIQWNSLLVDASYVKNIRGRNLLGRNPTDRGRNSSKISALTDKRGVPLSIIIEKGNVHDSKLLAITLDNIIIRKRCCMPAPRPAGAINDAKRTYTLILVIMAQNVVRQ